VQTEIAIATVRLFIVCTKSLCVRWIRLRSCTDDKITLCCAIFVSMPDPHALKLLPPLIEPFELLVEIISTGIDNLGLA